MGGGRGGSNMNMNNNTNNGVLNQIPASSKKLIQNIKEIVNFPDDEIYAMLKDCKMDPSEAVNRLLSQDTFHEVKSKREKKKETKDVTDSRPRGSSSSTRGGRSGMNHYSTRNNVTQYGSSDYAAPRGKSVYKKEIAPPVYTNSTTGFVGDNVNKWPAAVSESESILPTPQPSGFHCAWSGMSGQVSMADIVKMGRQQGKPSSNPNVSQQHVRNQQYDSHAPQNYASKVSEVNVGSGIAGQYSIPPNDSWLQDEEPPAVGSSVVEHPLESEPYSEHYDDSANLQSEPYNDVRYEGDDIVDDGHATFVESNQHVQENDPVGASGFDNDHYENTDSYQVHQREVEDPNVSVSSMANNFGSLALSKEEEEEEEEEEEDTQSEDDGPTVKIPEHLQVQTANLSHLSFGSFGSGMGAPFSESFAARPVHEEEEEAAASPDAPSAGNSEARNTEYYEDDHLRTATADGSNAHRIGAGTGNFEAPSVSQTDMLQQESPEVAQLNQYSFPSTTANYMYENNQQLNSSLGQSPASSQMMQGLPSLPGVMPYSNSLPNALLASNMHALREAEPAYSQFPTSQSMSGKYANSGSSLSGPTSSMTEALKTGNLAAQPTQGIPGGNVSGATGLPQHLAMHPYSQHSVPVGPLNMMGYPFLHQGYSYMPSAFQQAFAAGNSTYPQSLAAMLPQYKNSVSMNSLPQSGAVPSGYAGFGNSNNIPSNFSLNPPSAPPGNSINYEDVLSSQYKDATHLLSLQQGAESRTMSGVPGYTYYSSQGQNQQPAGFRQSQQPPSQHYGGLAGYPNYYHSQGGLSLDHHQQMSRDSGSLGGGSQGQQPKQSQQHMWQNSY